jgi:integrase
VEPRGSRPVRSNAPYRDHQRPALALLLYAGCRLADVVSSGPQHIKDGWLTYAQNENRNTSSVTLSLPVLPLLADIIAATPSGHLNFVVSHYGRPYTIEGFGKRWRKGDGCRIAPLHPHGLRKTGAVRVAENGATAHELMAISGWKDIKQTARYTAVWCRKIWLAAPWGRWRAGQKANICFPLRLPLRK